MMMMLFYWLRAGIFPTQKPLYFIKQSDGMNTRGTRHNSFSFSVFFSVSHPEIALYVTLSLSLSLSAKKKKKKKGEEMCIEGTI